MSLEDIKRRQREDAERQLVDPEAHVGELTAGRRWKLFRAWFSRELDAWTVRFERVGKLITAVAKIIGGAGIILGFAWRVVVFYKSRGIGPAEQQKTRVASTALDRVDKPKDP